MPPFQDPETLPEPKDDSKRLVAALLVARRQKRELRRHRLNQGRLVAGSARDCGLRIEDRSVSRQHADLELVPGAVMVRDLGSTNGTFYQGAKVTEVLVPLGGTVFLGKVELQILRLLDLAEVRLGEVASRSPRMVDVLRQLARLGDSEVSILLQGETGTGKDLLARAVHQAGPRAGKPFVVVDCAALPRELAESELFGHHKGAFTGAESSNAGAFQRAHGGTLFLDEIGELPLSQQPLLLRALERREVKPLGAAEYVPVNIRVIAATHQDLRARVEQGRFRRDLLERLEVIRVEVPPLRDRREDIPLLVQGMLDANPRAEGFTLSPGAMASLSEYHWPGNVRELRNAVERAVALHEEGSVTGGDLSLRPAGQDPDPPLDYAAARKRALASFEREFLVHLLERSGDNLSRAARDAGIDRVYLYRLLSKHGIKSRSR